MSSFRISDQINKVGDFFKSQDPNQRNAAIVAIALIALATITALIWACRAIGNKMKKSSTVNPSPEVKLNLKVYDEPHVGVDITEKKA